MPGFACWRADTMVPDLEAMFVKVQPAWMVYIDTFVAVAWSWRDVD